MTVSWVAEKMDMSSTNSLAILDKPSGKLFMKIKYDNVLRIYPGGTLINTSPRRSLAFYNNPFFLFFYFFLFLLIRKNN